MASVYRVGVANLICNKFSTRLCKTLKKHHVVQVAFLSGVGKYVEVEKPPPFPYWRKKIGHFRAAIDPLTYRFDENSKIIVVDGPPAVGKSKLCQALADYFNLLYMPAPTFDDLHIDTEGHDYRAINKKLKLANQILDLESYHRHPDYARVATVQLDFFYMRLEQYLNALTHLISTGQGVVLNRSLFSDVAFINTMHKCGHINKIDFTYYNLVVSRTLPMLLRPHAVVYLDAPVNKVMEKIKQRGVPYEVESKVFNEEYFKALEDNYKNVYLKSISDHAYVLCFDWAKEGTVKSVATELEILPLDNVSKTGKQRDWVFHTVADLKYYHRLYHQCRTYVYNEMEIDPVKVPDTFWAETSRVTAQYEAIEKLFGKDYANGHIPPVNESEKELWDDVIIWRIRKSPRDFKYRKIGPVE